MRRLAVIVAAVAMLGGCRPGDVESWVRSYELRPRAALRHLREHHPRIWRRMHRPVRWSPETACSQWAQLAVDMGWTPDQWVDPLSWIMHRESRCEPGATSPAGARGLLQVMPMWADDCGGGDLYDPAFNLACGLHVYRVQGWHAWDVY